MKATDKIDAARIDLLLSELRLPGIKLIWAALAMTADREGWAAARFLAALAEQEMVERTAVASNGIWRKPDCRRERTLRHVRLHRCANDLEGAGASARGRRRLARKGSRSFVLSGRPAGNPISRRRSVWP